MSDPTEPKDLAHGNAWTISPKNLQEALALAKVYADSEIVPKDYRGKPGNVLVAVQFGAELGIPPLQSLQNIAVIGGRPTMWGDLVLALVRRSDKLVSFEERGADEALAQGEGWCKVLRRGDAKALERRFSVEDAKRAGLWERRGKDGQTTPWVTYPGRMLQLRARAFALRDAFGDVLRGLQVREEVEDMEEIGTTPEGHSIMRPRRKGEPEEPNRAEVLQDFLKDVQVAPGENPTVLRDGEIQWKNASVQVESVEERKWEKDGKSGVFWIVLAGGVKYATFEPNHADEASVAQREGRTVRIESKPGRYGPVITRIVADPAPEAKP